MIAVEVPGRNTSSGERRHILTSAPSALKIQSVRLEMTRHVLLQRSFDALRFDLVIRESETRGVCYKHGEPVKVERELDYISGCPWCRSDDGGFALR